MTKQIDNKYLALGGANIVVNAYYVPICKTYINVLCNYTPSTLHIQRHSTSTHVISE